MFKGRTGVQGVKQDDIKCGLIKTVADPCYLFHMVNGT